MPLPSYARSTIASERRTHAEKCDRLSTPTKESSLNATPLRREVYRPFSLSTASSCAKASNQAFRFLDLPAELRNQIYEFASLDRMKRTIELFSADWFNDLPALLKINRQIRHEFGAYYFSGGKFKIKVSQKRLAHFSHLLRQIGRLNCERLAANPNVTIWVDGGRRFLELHRRPYDFELEESYLNGREATTILNLASEYQHIVDEATTACTIEKWIFVPFARWHTYTQFESYWTSVRSFDIQTLMTIRQILNSLFATLKCTRVKEGQNWGEKQVFTFLTSARARRMKLFQPAPSLRQDPGRRPISFKIRRDPARPR